MECPGCSVAPGHWHLMGCEWEQCPYCGQPSDSCDCHPPLDDRMPWTGCCPWIIACLEYEFFEKRVKGRWVPCDADDPNSEPDLNRLVRECVWSRAEKRFVRRRQTARE